MRILVLADIHANWPALQAIDEPHDVCFFLGDLVGYGLEAAPCVQWVRQNARNSIRGNHDHDLAQLVSNSGPSGLAYLATQTRALTRPTLRKEDLHFLSGLPVTRYATAEEKRFFLVHGSPRDPLEELSQADEEFWFRRLGGIEADCVCVGHTHSPYVLKVNGKIIVNPGSVGFPRDGDPRASYAVIQDGEAEIKRVSYPIEKTVNSIEESGLPDDAKEWLTQWLRTGGEASLMQQLKEKVD